MSVLNSAPLVKLKRRLGRTGPARAAYERALEVGMNEPLTGHLRRRLADLPADPST